MKFVKTIGWENGTKRRIGYYLNVEVDFLFREVWYRILLVVVDLKLRKLRL